jgi:hypothetical protein
MVMVQKGRSIEGAIGHPGRSECDPIVLRKMLSPKPASRRRGRYGEAPNRIDLQKPASRRYMRGGSPPNRLTVVDVGCVSARRSQQKRARMWNRACQPRNDRRQLPEGVCLLARGPQAISHIE